MPKLGIVLCIIPLFPGFDLIILENLMTCLKWSLRVFPSCQDRYDLSECHRLYGLCNYQESP